MSGLKEFYLRHPDRSWLLIICVVFLAIFGRGLWFPAEIMDDVLYINLNRKLDFTWANVVYWWKTPILDLHSPLQMYSYMLDRLIWGEQYFVFGCHLQNYLWHLIAVFSLFMIGRELGMRRAFAGVSALIFAIHPQRIESTVWLSERKDVLVLAFAMLSIWIFLRNLNNKFRMMQIIPPLLMLASLLSKPMAILLPLIILAILWHIRRNWDWRYYLRHLWPFLLVGLIYMAVKSTMVENYAKIAISGAEPMSIRLAIIANNFGNYFFKTIYPYSLFPVYPFYNPLLDTLWPGIAFGLVVASSFGYFLARKKYNFAVFDLLPLLICFVAALVPVVGIIRVGNTDFADRYSYFAAAFIWIFVGFVFQWLWDNFVAYRRLMAGAVTVYVLIIGIYSINYLSCWQSGRDHMEASLDHPAPNFRIAFLAGIEAFHEKDFERLQYVCDEMLKIYPHYPENRRQAIEAYRLCMKGMTLFAMNRENEGIVFLNKLILTPRVIYMRDFAFGFPKDVMQEAARYHLSRGNKELAALVLNNIAANYERLIKLDFYFYKGMSAYVVDDFKTAEHFFSLAAEENPDDENVRHNLENTRKKL